MMLTMKSKMSLVKTIQTLEDLDLEDMLDDLDLDAELEGLDNEDA